MSNIRIGKQMKLGVRGGISSISNPILTSTPAKVRGKGRGRGRGRGRGGGRGRGRGKAINQPLNVVISDEDDDHDHDLSLQQNQDLLDRHEYLINNPHDTIDEDMPLHAPIPPVAPVPDNPPPSEGNLIKEPEEEEDTDKDYLFKCELIELVQMHSLLYDTAHPDYHKDQKRINAWDEIASALDIDIQDIDQMKWLKRQWKNLRGKFRKIYLDVEKKLAEIKSKRTGGGGGAAAGGDDGEDGDGDDEDEEDNDGSGDRSPGKKKSGDKGDKEATLAGWRYYEKLSFLKRFIHAAETISNLLPRGRRSDTSIDMSMDRESDPNTQPSTTWRASKTSTKEDIQTKLLELLEKEMTASGVNPPEDLQAPKQPKDHIDLQLESFAKQIRSFGPDHQDRVLFELHSVLHRYQDNLRLGRVYSSGGANYNPYSQHAHHRGLQQGHGHPQRSSSATSTVPRHDSNSNSNDHMGSHGHDRVLGFDEY